MDSVLSTRLRAHVADPTGDLADLDLSDAEIREAVRALADFEPPSRATRLLDAIDGHEEPGVALASAWGSVDAQVDAPLVAGSIPLESLDHSSPQASLDLDPIGADIAFAAGSEDDPLAVLGLDEPAIGPTAAAEPEPAADAVTADDPHDGDWSPMDLLADADVDDEADEEADDDDIDV